MLHYCQNSENTQLIIDRFNNTLNKTDQLFLAGAKGSEFSLLIQEYCHANQIDLDSIITLQPSMLDEAVLTDMMTLLGRNPKRPEIVVVRINAGIDVVAENKLLRFVDNPAFSDAKLVIVMDEFDPFEEVIHYSDTLVERSKASLFVLPALKNRLADLAHFTVSLLKKYQRQTELRSPITFDESAMNLWLRYDWPGNYEELSEVVRALVYGSVRGGVLSEARIEEVLNLRRTVPFES